MGNVSEISRLISMNSELGSTICAVVMCSGDVKQGIKMPSVDKIQRTAQAQLVAQKLRLWHLFQMEIYS